MTETAAVKIPERWRDAYEREQNSLVVSPSSLNAAHQAVKLIEELGAAEAERDALRIKAQVHAIDALVTAEQNRELREALEKISLAPNLFRAELIASAALAAVTSPPVTE